MPVRTRWTPKPVVVSVERASSSFIDRVLTEAVELAQADAPVDTGAHRDSIHSEKVGDEKGLLIADTDHSIFVEVLHPTKAGSMRRSMQQAVRDQKRTFRIKK